jgi:hypothetical protein
MVDFGAVLGPVGTGIDILTGDKLKDIGRKLDPTRPVSTASASDLRRGAATPEQIREMQRKGQAGIQQRGMEALNRLGQRAAPQVQIPGLQAPKAAQIAAVQGPQAAQLGTAGQELRGGQMEALNLIKQRATGAAPTVAEQQFRRNLEQTLAAQTAAANVAGTPAAQRLAAVQGSQAMQAGAGEAAILGQQERAQAEQALLGGLGAVRGQDLQRGIAQAQLEQQAGLAGFQAATDRAARQAQLEQQAGLTGFQTEADRLARQTTLQAQLDDQQLQRMAQLESQLLQQGFTADQARQQAELTMRAQDLGVNTAAEQAAQQARAQAEQAKTGILGGITGALGSLGAAAILSDERAKENVTDGNQSVQAFLDSISPKDFNYKGGNEKQTGVMAQDVEQTPAGEGMVEEMAGLKTVKPDIGMLLASFGNLNQRLRQLEGGA